MLIAMTATAGQVQPAQVIVNIDEDGSGSAQGDMRTARNADNNFELIGCGIRMFSIPAGTFSFGFCQATDHNEVQAFCSTNNAELLQAMHATSDNSFVTFSFDADGECRRIGFSTQSFYLSGNPNSKGMLKKSQNGNN
jgi:hypothetical protein